MGESILQLRQIRKSFDNTEVLKGIDLEVAQGEFITLLGASGCGKTTTLRIIAGLELPDVGQTLVLNANNDLVQYLLANKDGEHSDMFCKQLYDLAMISHQPLQADKMTEFINRSNEIMMLLTK